MQTLRDVVKWLEGAEESEVSMKTMIFDGFTRTAKPVGPNIAPKKRKPVFKRKAGGIAHLGGSAIVEVR